MEDLLEGLTIPPDPPCIQEVLHFYDITKPPTDNISLIEKQFYRESISLTVNFIKSLNDKFPDITQRITQRHSRTKLEYAGDISIFVRGITPINCQECDQDYIHSAVADTEGNQVSCFLCNRHSHKECYTNETQMKKGLYFLCHICVTKAQKDVENLDTTLSQIQSQQIQSAQNPHHQEVDESGISDDRKIPPRTPAHSVASSDSFHNRQRTSSNHNEDSHDVKNKNEQKICPMYLENTCPHGISGKGCSFYHPPRCFRYSKHGEDRWDGCTRGRRCWYFHPRLCQNSVRMKMCLTKTCKEVHIIGTRRYKPRDDYHQTPFQDGNATSEQQSYHQRYQQREQQNRPPPWNKPEERRENMPEVRKEIINQKGPSEAEQTNHFLVKYLESMKADITKSLELKIESALHSVREIQPRQTVQPQVNSQQTMPPQVTTQTVSSTPPDHLQSHNPYIQMHPQQMNQYAPQMIPPY